MCSITECPLHRLLVNPPEMPTYRPMCLRSSDVSGRYRVKNDVVKEQTPFQMVLRKIGICSFALINLKNVNIQRDPRDLGHNGLCAFDIWRGVVHLKHVAWTIVMLMMTPLFCDSFSRTLVGGSLQEVSLPGVIQRGHMQYHFTTGCHRFPMSVQAKQTGSLQVHNSRRRSSAEPRQA